MKAAERQAVVDDCFEEIARQRLRLSTLGIATGEAMEVLSPKDMSSWNRLRRQRAMLERATRSLTDVLEDLARYGRPYRPGAVRSRRSRSGGRA